MKAIVQDSITTGCLLRVDRPVAGESDSSTGLGPHFHLSLPEIGAFVDARVTLVNLRIDFGDLLVKDYRS
jgi:hypothetical protein